MQQDLLGVLVQHAQDEVLGVVGKATVEEGRQVADGGRLAVVDLPCGLFAHSERQRCEQEDVEEAPACQMSVCFEYMYFLSL